MIAFRALLAGVVLGAAAAGAAARDDVAPLPEGRPPEWGVAAGFGWSVQVNTGRSHEQLFLFEPGVSFRLGNRLEWVVEGHFARYFRPEGFMAGVVPIGLRFYASKGSVLPYVYVGAGGGWTDLTQLDEIDRRFNFLLEGAVGVRGQVGGGHAWTLEARLSHVSNAGTASPNLGLNCVLLVAGWRF